MYFTRRSFLKATIPALAFGASGNAQSLSAATSLPSAPVAAPESDEICFTSARELARLIRNRQLSAREVMAAHLHRIERLNPKLNAIVAKLGDEQCLALADAADQQQARGEPLAPLHGLPIAIKDTESVVGFPFTRGSPIFRNDLPKVDSVVVERLRRA